MSLRLTSKGEQMGSESKRKFFYHSTAERPFVVHNVLNPSPLLHDRNEFPSLTESSQKFSVNQDSEGKLLKYSDKLKATCQNQNFLSKSVPVKNDSPKTIVCSQMQNKTPEKQFSGKMHQTSDKAKSVKSGASVSSLQTSIKKSEFADPKDCKNAVKNCNQKQWNQSQMQSKHENQVLGQNSTKQIGQRNPSSVNIVQHTFKKTYDYNNRQTDPKKEVKCTLRTDKSIEKKDQEKEDGTKAKKKKKRKSKVKRQVALQTGKITVLTPEVHSKILNQSSALNSHNVRNTMTDINNEEEYPELGKSFVPTSQKENSVKKEVIALEKTQEVIEKISDTTVEKQELMTKELTEKNMTDVKAAIEKKGKNESKTVHLKDPITVSFLDMLSIKPVKAKVKEVKEEVILPKSIPLAKLKTKKTIGHPHNLLDSSPAIKRGKERETPKVKKPSHLKKIILLDRKMRREHLLKSNQAEDVTLNGSEIQPFDSTVEVQNPEPCNDVISSILSKSPEDCVSSDVYNPLSEELDKEVDEFLYHNEDLNEFLNEELSYEVSKNISNIDKNVQNDCGTNICNIIKEEMNTIAKPPATKVSTESSNLIEKHSKSVESTDLLLKTLNSTPQTVEFTEKEKAAKILLHTRHFREYCNHLISEDIDEVVLALLDDLARFQDRLHQRDPVKAKMKRRMTYGVKEVKKHIKLKKLKLIVIAADIENVEAEGGLNDILSDIKALAADHHIPCVFALSRKEMGKVCHKPVPISCVGIFNYEGSEVNFKKIIELHTQSKKDYAEILKNLTSRITDEEASKLIKARKEAPDTLHALRSNILREFFVSSKSEDCQNENLEVLEETTNE